MNCREALELLATRRLMAWHGLPACRLETVTEMFPRIGDGLGRGRLGERTRDYVLVRAAGYEEPLRVWIDDDDAVLEVDVEYPAMDDLASRLGDPPARRDFQWAGNELHGGELVYPHRGVALFVNPDTQELLRLAVFRPTSPDEYDRELRLQLVGAVRRR